MKILTNLLAVMALGLIGSGAVAAELGADGLHEQPFYSDTFLDLAEDLSEAREAGKDLIVLVEQNACPYCREMHEVNFARPEIADYIAEHYMVVQLDLWGSREVTDFDGETLEERDLMRKWFVNFTPTTLFFTLDDPDTPPASMRDALTFLMPGYFKPFHHMTALEFVASDAYKDQPSFQRWLNERADRLRAEGKEVVVWE